MGSMQLTSSCLWAVILVPLTLTRTGAFSVRIVDDYWIHIIGGRQAVRTSELCQRKTNDAYGNDEEWGDDWQCEFFNTVTSSPDDLEYVFGYTHTMDVSADYCMN